MRFHERAIVLPARLAGVAPLSLAPDAAPPPPPSPPAAPAAPTLPVAQEPAAIEAVLAGLRDAARSLRSAQQAPLAEVQRVAVELAVVIAERLLHQAIRAGQFGIEAIVRDAVDRLKPRDAVAVSLHPLDLALLRKRLGDDAPLLADGPEVRLVADARLKRGVCKVQAGEAAVWADAPRQLAALRESLLEDLTGDVA